MIANTNIIIAFEAEARPLIDRLELEEVRGSGRFKHFNREAIDVVISGWGKARAAAATGWLAEITEAGAVWLNTGIAGHSKLATGEAFVAVKLTDGAAGSSWFPPQLVKSQFTPSVLTTVDVPEEDYPGVSGFDMEASSFMQVARRFSTAELVQCVKIVSDNPGSPPGKPDPARATALMSKWTAGLVGYLSVLTELQDELPASGAADIDILLSRWHFTVTEENQLRTAARNWQAVFGEGPGKFIEASAFKNPGALIQALQGRLKTCVPSIQGPRAHD